MSSEKIYTTVGMSEQTVATLRGYCKAQDRSLGFVCEEALRQFFSKLLVEGETGRTHAK